MIRVTWLLWVFVMSCKTRVCVRQFRLIYVIWCISKFMWHAEKSMFVYISKQFWKTNKVCACIRLFRQIHISWCISGCLWHAEKCKYTFHTIQTDSYYLKHLWVFAKCWKKCVYPQVITCRFTLVDASLGVCDLLKKMHLCIRQFKWFRWCISGGWWHGEKLLRPLTCWK